MRWPFVTREMYDMTVGMLNEEREGWKALANDVVARYHQLKLQGAAIPEAPRPIEKPPVDMVMSAITAASGGDARLRHAMIAEANRMRAADYSEMQIIEAIQNGTSSPEGLPI